MKKIQNFIVRLLLFFYLTSSYLGATHIHNDAVEHASDCKICIVVKNIHGGTAPDLDAPCFICDCYDEVILFNTLFIDRTTIKGFHSNAPPFFS